MEKSTNFQFNLPSSAEDDPADVTLISDNFEIIDEVLMHTDNAFDASSNNPQSGVALSPILGSTHFKGLLSFEVGTVLEVATGYVASATDCVLTAGQYSIFIPCTVAQGSQTAKAQVWVYQYGASTPFTSAYADIVTGGIKAVIKPTNDMSGITIGILTTSTEIDSLSDFGITEIKSYTSKVSENRKVAGHALTADVTDEMIRRGIQNMVINPSVETIKLNEGDRAVFLEKSVLIVLFSDASMYYQSELYFTSGATATAFSYPDNVYFTGDSCANGVFIPTTNTRYAIIFYYDAGIAKMQAVVRGVPIG